MIATSTWEYIMPLLVLLPFGLPAALFVYILATVIDEASRDETPIERIDRRIRERHDL